MWFFSSPKILQYLKFKDPKIQRALSRVFCSSNNYQLENCGIDPSMYLEWQLILTWLQWGWRVIHSNCPLVSLQHPLCTHLQIQHSLKPYSAFWSLSLQTKKRSTRETDKPNQFFCFFSLAVPNLDTQVKLKSQNTKVDTSESNWSIIWSHGCSFLFFFFHPAWVTCRMSNTPYKLCGC